MNDDLPEPTTSRRGFLRKVGTTITVGIGVAAVPALAKAGPQYVAYVCCPDNGTHCSTCQTGVQYWCTNPNCPIGFCTSCKPKGQCYDDVLPGCV